VITPAIITAAICGAETMREQTPYLPITAEELGEEAARCREAGAAVVHLHVRTPDGKPTQDRETFRRAIDEIRKRSDIVIQTSTGGAVGMSAEERAQPVELKPEMATLNCGTINFGDEIFTNPLPLVRDMARRIRAAGSVPELEIYEVGHWDTAQMLMKEGLLARPFHVQFVLGVRGAMAPGEGDERLKFLVSLLPPGEHWTAAGIGRNQLPLAERALALGGHCRVGLEDNIYLSKGVLAKGSYELVAAAAKAARARGREPAAPDLAREILGVPRRAA
jgi:3-keto-5-aminohexanoate cleavage enzyme